MLIFAHIFIGKEFKDLVSSIGRATFKYGGSTANANINYLIADCNKGNISFSRLKVSSTANNPEFESFDKFINAEWEDNAYSVPLSDFSTKWTEMYGDLINDGDNAENLNVILHFPIYKKGAFETLKSIHEVVCNSNLPTEIDFFGYSEDLAKCISEKEKSDETAKNFAIEYTQFRKERELSDSTHLILLQNCNRLGIPKKFDKEMLAEVISQFAMSCTQYYKQLFPNVVNYSDVVAFGISTLQVDRFLMANYLIHRSILNTMNKASVRNDKVDVNLANKKASEILKDKKTLFSEFLKQNSSCDMDKVHDYFKNEADKIVENCNEVIKREKDITMKAAVLASLLSKTDCPLYSESVYDTNTERVYDLFSEGIDYFLENDYGMYLTDDETLLTNPIPILKEIDSKVINTETEIRHLEKEHEMLSSQIETTKKVESCFIEDGIFHFNNQEYRLMPSHKEELLEETYQAKEESITLPESVDLRGCFRPAQNQGTQCSCLSFAMTSVFEYAMKNNSSEEIDLSEAFLYYNSRLKDECDDVSTSLDSGSRFKPTVEALYEYGIAREEFCQYDENEFTTKPSNDAYTDAATRKLIKALNVTKNVRDIKSALSEGYPVVTSFELCESFANASGNGYVQLPTDEEVEKHFNGEQAETKHSSHAMVITGYSDQLQRFIVRNSWGKDWGDNGYCYIPYSYINDRLINMACILTEIQSFEKVKMVDVPSLTIDNHDLTIRYYINQALLDSNSKELVSFKQKRKDLMIYFETLINRLASAPNDRDAYIQSGVNAIQTQVDTIDEQLKDVKKETEENKKDMKKFNIKVTLISAVVAIITILLLYIWNRFTSDERHIGYFKSLYVIVPALLFILFKANSRWKEFRELFYGLEIKQKRLEKEKAEKEEIIKNFKFRTFVAWYSLREANRVRSVISELYTKFLSLINNLRAWYTELENDDNSITVELEQPNTSLIEKERLDLFYENVISKDAAFEVDFSKDMNEYRIDEAYLKTYKEKLISTILLKILTHPDITNFNLTRHTVGDGVSVDWVKDIDRKVTSSWMKMADIFIQLSKSTDPSMQCSQYLLAPSVSDYTNALHNKINGFYRDLEISNKYLMVYINIATLRVEDCAMFVN